MTGGGAGAGSLVAPLVNAGDENGLDGAFGSNSSTACSWLEKLEGLSSQPVGAALAPPPKGGGVGNNEEPCEVDACSGGTFSLFYAHVASVEVESFSELIRSLTVAEQS